MTCFVIGVCSVFVMGWWVCVLYMCGVCLTYVLCVEYVECMCYIGWYVWFI